MAFMKNRWKQYEEMLAYAARNLADSRGLNGKWNSKS
jgi:hypothetical protein